jgi:hypothetical protein
MNFGFRISDFGFAARPPRARSPQITQIDTDGHPLSFFNAKAQRRLCASAALRLCVSFSFSIDALLKVVLAGPEGPAYTSALVKGYLRFFPLCFSSVSLCLCGCLPLDGRAALHFASGHVGWRP